MVTLDKRNQAIEAAKEEVISADQQRLVVDAFLRYRISNPLQFYRTLRDETHGGRPAGAADQLLPAPGAGRGHRDDIISRRARRPDGPDAGRRAPTRRPLAPGHRGHRPAHQARRPAGRQPAGGLSRACSSNLQQQAAQIRAVGEQQKREIIADADKQVTITLANATQQSFTTRGEGDAQSARIFAKSFGKDPRFAAFYRSHAGL